LSRLQVKKNLAPAPLPTWDCVVPENIHTPLMGGFLLCAPLPPINSSLAAYFASKILAFKTPPLPLGISDDLQ